MNKGRWKLTGKRYDFIKEVVCDLFIRYKVKCIPVSGFEIAFKMGVSLVAYSGLSEKKRGVVLGLSKDGFVYINKNRTYIYYNDMRISYERQNWTVLHEIGHIVLNHMGNNAQEEYEADFFAKYAIAPPVLVHRIKPESFWDIYEHFDISFTAAIYAYNYYQTWRRRYESIHVLAPYEKRMLAYQIKCS